MALKAPADAPLSHVKCYSPLNVSRLCLQRQACTLLLLSCHSRGLEVELGLLINVPN
jgi:hypothetical protein